MCVRKPLAVDLLGSASPSPSVPLPRPSVLGESAVALHPHCPADAGMHSWTLPDSSAVHPALSANAQSPHYAYACRVDSGILGHFL